MTVVSTGAVAVKYSVIVVGHPVRAVTVITVVWVWMRPRVEVQNGRP